MQDLTVMDVLDGKGHLNKPVQDLILAVTNLAYLLLVGDLRVQVTTVRIIHDNAQTPLVHEWLLVSNDVRMTHCFKNMHLIDSILSLLAVHLRHINDLHDVSLTIRHRLDKYGEAEWTFADNFKFTIALHIDFVGIEFDVLKKAFWNSIYLL